MDFWKFKKSKGKENLGNIPLGLHYFVDQIQTPTFSLRSSRTMSIQHSKFKPVDTPNLVRPMMMPAVTGARRFRRGLHRNWPCRPLLLVTGLARATRTTGAVPQTCQITSPTPATTAATGRARRSKGAAAAKLGKTLAPHQNQN